MDASCSHTTTMSNIPMPSPAPGGPKKAFEDILNNIITSPPAQRLAIVWPHLLTFLSHPIIKELASQSKAPAQAQPHTSNNLELQKIQDSLMQLSKAVDALKKGNPPPHKANKDNASKAKPPASHKPPPRIFLAIAGSRPPNPSLVVDLSHLGIKLEDWVKPEVLCNAINRKLIAIDPPPRPSWLLQGGQQKAIW